MGRLCWPSRQLAGWKQFRLSRILSSISDACRPTLPAVKIRVGKTDASRVKLFLKLPTKSAPVVFDDSSAGRPRHGRLGSTCARESQHSRRWLIYNHGPARPPLGSVSRPNWLGPPIRLRLRSWLVEASTHRSR